MRRVLQSGTVVLLLAFAVVSGNAKPNPAPQVSAGSQTSTTGAHTSIMDQDSGPRDPFKEKLEAQASKSRNNDRQKRLIADTDKLLQLSTELKMEVEKTTKNEMSVQVIQKAAEIEKLAHDVKERMKGQ